MSHGIQTASTRNRVLFFHRAMSAPLKMPMEASALERAAVELSIVMPCLNEAETLQICVAKAQEALRAANICGEVIVADNGSTDGSQRIAQDCGARLVNVEQRGYGSALRGGIAAARGKYVVMGDADASYDFSHIPRFLAGLRAGSDLVMGNRFLGGIAEGAMPRLHRYLGNPALTWLGRLFFKAPCGDFYCGLRGFRKDAYEKMGLRTAGMEFATEMVVKAALLGMRVSEVPTTLSPDGRTRPPHLRTWRDGWRGLRFLLLYSPRWLFLYPGIFWMLAGTVVSGWLITGPKQVGSVTFDVDTLIYAVISILLGFQAITIALFAKVFAISQGLHPADRKVERFFSYANLETGLLTGALVFLIGLGLSVYAVVSWRARHFGQLNTDQMLRLTMPAAVSMTLGFQLSLASFFLSLLRIKRE
jgi:glycosyltransferase involved in cell wall biosynthesis